MPSTGTQSKSGSKTGSSASKTKVHDTLQDNLVDPLTKVSVTKKTRFHVTADAPTDDYGRNQVNAAKNTLTSTGGTTGDKLAANTNMWVDYGTVDTTGTWVKGFDNAKGTGTAGWLRMDKLKSASLKTAFKTGDKIYGLKGTGDRPGYDNQISKEDPRYDELDRPTNMEFVNQLQNGFGEGQGMIDAQGGRDKTMKDIMVSSPVFGDYMDMPGPQIASQAALDANLQTLQDGNKIRFMLDGLDLKDVVKTGKHKDKSTSHELRYIYRNRDQFAGKVAFYKGDKRCPAPWVLEPGLWADGASDKIEDDM